MFMVNQLVGFGAVGASGASITIGTASVAVSSADTASYSGGTFDGMAIGTAAADRYIIALVAGQSGGATTVDSVTVGGVSLTLVTKPSTLGACGIYIGNVPTGTTANAAFTFSGAQLRGGIVLLPAYGINPTATDTDSDATHAYSVSLDVPAGGVGVGVATGNGSSGSTATWTGITEIADQNMEDGPITAAATVFADAQTGLSITCTLTTGPSTPGSAFAAFAPA